MPSHNLHMLMKNIYPNMYTNEDDHYPNEYHSKLN